ncbi:thiamine-monophosphate kinase [Verrucomicrobiota bacterium]
MPDKTLSDTGEIQTLQRLCRNLPTRDDVRVGAGDDCAVVNFEDPRLHVAGRKPAPGTSYDWLLKTDPVIEGVHFASETSAAAVGHKALGRVLSDIAAMGGEPLWILIDVVAPPGTPSSRIDEMYKALSALASRYDVAVVGGDIARGPVLELHVFGVGRVKRGKAVLRSGAKPGHNLFVTGSLGGSGAARHLCFEPRVTEGRWLCEEGWASAMIDLSDGLASDIRRLTDRSRTGAELALDSIPLSEAVLDHAHGCSPLHHALTDGEDFELLFTVPEEKAKSLPSAWKKEFDLACTCIGSMTATQGVVECIDRDGNRTRLEESGYDHFA